VFILGKTFQLSGFFSEQEQTITFWVGFGPCMQMLYFAEKDQKGQTR